MKTILTVRHMENNSIIQDYFQERAGKLGRHLNRFRDDLIYLHGTLDKNPHKEEFYASLSLFLPTAALHCTESGFDFTAAINAVFLDMVRQVEKHTDKLSREKRRREKRV